MPFRHRRSRTTVAACATAFALAACSAGAEKPPVAGAPPPVPDPRWTLREPEHDMSYVQAQPVEYAYASGNVVDLYYLEGPRVCSRLAGVRVVETARAVTVTVLDGTPAGFSGLCYAVGYPARTRIVLHQPLGDRELRNGDTSFRQHIDVRH